MAKYPALPLFTDAFIADTTHLSAAQTGAYIMLLIVAWRTPECALFDDDVLLARWSRMELRTWRQNKPVIMQFWDKDEMGRWVQGRLKDERNYVDVLSNKNAAAGRASALKRKNRHSTTVPTKPQRDFNPHTHTSTEESKLSPGTDAPKAPVDKSPEEVVDFKKIIFNEGLRFMVKATGKPEDTMRRLFGKWCRDYGDAPTATAIMEAQKFTAVEPISYIENFLKEKKHETTKRSPAGRVSRSEQFKRNLVEGTLADIEGKPGSDEDAG